MKRTFMVGLAAALVLAACGDDDAASDTSEAAATTQPATTAPATTAAAATSAPAVTTTPTDAPERIVSLSATHTEILFAIGAGDQVVAVDEYSNYPKEATELPNELSGFTPNVEAIAGYEPDLVVVSQDDDLVGQLNDLGIATWVGPAAVQLDDTYTQIEQLGAETGHVGDAAELVGQMQSDIARLTSDLPRTAEPLTYFHEVDDTYYTATSSTFIGEVYSLFGLRNIADQAETKVKDYPQLNAEFVVSADPDIIFLADSDFGVSPEKVAQRDGWADVSAVRNDLVVPMNADLASRWGPRVVDYIAEVAEAVDRAAALQPTG